jgi:hypothetical protein
MTTTRRALLQFLSAAAIVPPVGTEIEIHEAPIDPRRTLVVFRFPGRLSANTAVRMRQQWDGMMVGTPWEPVKCIVVDDGVRMDLLTLPLDEGAE